MEKIEVMRILGDWFRKFGWTVYFNQKNPDDYMVFHANSNSKPDILLEKNGYHVLVEAKEGEKHQDLLNGIDQLFRYAGEYYTGRRKYFLDPSHKTDIPIDAICLATNFSRSGYLYGDEDSVGYLKHGYLAREKDLIEKPTTHSLTRFVWRQWEKGYVIKHFRNIRNGKASNEVVLPEKPYIGTIMAKTEKQNRQVSNDPYMFLNSNEFAPMKYNKIFCFEE